MLMRRDDKMDRRIQKSQHAIMEAFMSLVLDKGLENITLGEIAEKANVNRGTIYLHFIDKYDLRDKCLDYYLTQLSKTCIHDHKEDKLASKSGLLRIFDYLEINFQFYSSMLSNKESTFFRKRMKEIFKEGLVNYLDLSDKKVQKEISIEFLVSAGVGILEWWIYNSMPYPKVVVVEELWQLFKSIEQVEFK